MPTLLRLAIAAIAFVVLLAGAAVLALGRPSSGALLAGSAALAPLVLPALLAGSFVSWWSWDESARRRLRVWLAVLTAVQLVAIAGFTAVLFAVPAAAAGGAVVLIASIAADPIAVLLGRAALRAELRSPMEEDPDAILPAVRRGWRRAGIGAAIGIVIGLIAWAALGAVLGGDEGFLLRLLVFAPVPGALGASIGILTVTLGMAGRIRDLLGGEYSSGRRIGRAIAGKGDELSEQEAERAARYAAVAPAWLGLQQASQLLNGVVSLSVVANVAVNDSRFGWIAPVLGTAMVATFSTATVLVAVQRRRMRRYAAAHPVLPA